MVQNESDSDSSLQYNIRKRISGKKKFLNFDDEVNKIKTLTERSQDFPRHMENIEKASIFDAFSPPKFICSTFAHNCERSEPLSEKKNEILKKAMTQTTSDSISPLNYMYSAKQLHSSSLKTHTPSLLLNPHSNKSERSPRFISKADHSIYQKINQNNSLNNQDLNLFDDSENGKLDNFTYNNSENLQLSFYNPCQNLSVSPQANSFFESEDNSSLSFSNQFFSSTESTTVTVRSETLLNPSVSLKINTSSTKKTNLLDENSFNSSLKENIKDFGFFTFSDPIEFYTIISSSLLELTSLGRRHAKEGFLITENSNKFNLLSLDNDQAPGILRVIEESTNKILLPRLVKLGNEQTKSIRTFYNWIDSQKCFHITREEKLNKIKFLGISSSRGLTKLWFLLTLAEQFNLIERNKSFTYCIKKQTSTPLKENNYSYLFTESELYGSESQNSCNDESNSSQQSTWSKLKPKTRIISSSQFRGEVKSVKNQFSKSPHRITHEGKSKFLQDQFRLLKTAARYFGSSPRFSDPNINKNDITDLVYIEPPLRDQREAIRSFNQQNPGILEKLSPTPIRSIAEKYGLIEVIKNEQNSYGRIQLNLHPWNNSNYSHLWVELKGISNLKLTHWDILVSQNPFKLSNKNEVNSPEGLDKSETLPNFTDQAIFDPKVEHNTERILEDSFKQKTRDLEITSLTSDKNKLICSSISFDPCIENLTESVLSSQFDPLLIQSKGKINLDKEKTASQNLIEKSLNLEVLPDQINKSLNSCTLFEDNHLNDTFNFLQIDQEFLQGNTQTQKITQSYDSNFKDSFKNSILGEKNQFSRVNNLVSDTELIKMINGNQAIDNEVTKKDHSQPGEATIENNFNIIKTRGNKKKISKEKKPFDQRQWRITELLKKCLNKSKKEGKKASSQEDEDNEVYLQKRLKRKFRLLKDYGSDTQIKEKSNDTKSCLSNSSIPTNPDYENHLHEYNTIKEKRKRSKKAKREMRQMLDQMGLLDKEAEESEDEDLNELKRRLKSDDESEDSLDDSELSDLNGLIALSSEEDDPNEVREEAIWKLHQDLEKREEEIFQRRFKRLNNQQVEGLTRKEIEEIEREERKHLDSRNRERRGDRNLDISYFFSSNDEEDFENSLSDYSSESEIEKTPHKNTKNTSNHSECIKETIDYKSEKNIGSLPSTRFSVPLEAQCALQAELQISRQAKKSQSGKHTEPNLRKNIEFMSDTTFNYITSSHSSCSNTNANRSSKRKHSLWQLEDTLPIFANFDKINNKQITGNKDSERLPDPFVPSLQKHKRQQIPLKLMRFDDTQRSQSSTLNPSKHIQFGRSHLLNDVGSSSLPLVKADDLSDSIPKRHHNSDNNKSRGLTFI